MFQHGNGQQNDLNYDALDALTARGVVVALPLTPGSIDGGLSREPPLQCVVEALLSGQATDWSGTGRMSGVYAIAGHSTGGLAAFGVASDISAGNLLPASELVGVGSLAPHCPEEQDSSFDHLQLEGDADLGVIVLQASNDGDTVGCAPNFYDRVVTNQTGTTVTSSPRRAMVWAYDVEHNAFGGPMSGDCTPTDKGKALTESYLLEFLTQQLYGSTDTTFAVAQSPTVTSAVSPTAFWDPEFGGVPQIYGTYQSGVGGAFSTERELVDTFEDGDPASSDSGQAVSLSLATAVEVDLRTNPASLGLEENHSTGAALVNWEDGSTISWTLSPDQVEALTGATSIGLRFGVVAEPANPTACSGTTGRVPTLSMRLEGSGGTADSTQPLAPFFRAAVPDTRPEFDCSTQSNKLGCATWDHMQTSVRIPLTEFCAEPAFFLSNVDTLTLELSGDGGTLLLDDLVIDRTPGEPDVACRCLIPQ